MGSQVNKPASRSYSSPVRAEQARLTERRITDAAHRLFLAQGYGQTTLATVAREAGVSAQTIHNVFGTKPALLKKVHDLALVGDDEPIPMADRPEVQRMMRERDPARLIADWSRFTAAIARRLAPLYEVLIVAADGDPEVALLWAVSEENRTGGARSFTTVLDAIGGLRPDLPIDRATAIAEILMDPMPCRRLVLDAGWTVEEYASYLERMARAAFLPRSR